VASTYEKIATNTLSSSAASVTFTSISGAYTDLVLIINARNTQASRYGLLKFNSDSGSNYSQTVLIASASQGVVSSRNPNASGMYINYSDALPTAASTFAQFNINFNNYSNTTTYKTVLDRVSNTGAATEASVGLWRNTSAINNIEIFCDGGSYTAGSTFTLYGILKA
jgi:hypothetical protein